MKAWWAKAWAWFKANWKWIIFPVGLLLLALEVFSRLRGPQVVTIDPTREADERAKVEEETRQKQLEEERARLAGEERRIQADAEKDRQNRTDVQAGEVDRLREDPEELKRRMLRAGKP